MLTIAGVGPGNPKYLTVDVLERIKRDQYILAFGRVADSLQNIRKDIVKVNRIDEVIDYLNKKKEVLLLASGDPNFYGIVEFLKRKDIYIKEILPGLSSFQYLMSKLEKSWQDANFISLHGRKASLEEVKTCPLTIILTDRDNTPSYINGKLNNMKIKGKMYIGYNLSYDNEVILNINIGDEVEDISPLAVVIIENEMD